MKREIDIKSNNHLIGTPLLSYLYDINTNQIVEIDSAMYSYLQGTLCDEKITDGERKFLSHQLDEMRKMGCLKSYSEYHVQHPETLYVDDYIHNHLSSLLLQVTQECNLRCEYCVYSGKYQNRTHHHLFMNQSIAKEAIDYIFEHSVDNDNLFIGFYGGEPLLAFDLIHWCLDYIDEIKGDKHIYYNITTNGTLLNKEIIYDFIKHDVMMLISLDGPEPVHDSKRVFRDNSPTFYTIMNNLQLIKSIDSNYYRNNVEFNVVLHGKNYKIIREFFTEEPLVKENCIILNNITDNYISDETSENSVDEHDIIEYRHDMFRALCQYIQLDNMDPIKNKMVVHDVYRILELESLLGKRERIPKYWHRSGGCMPGIHKLFMTVSGKFYPCERVSEVSDVCCIGDIHSGLDSEKIKKLMNIELYTEKECKSCWASSFCQICLSGLEGLYDINKSNILNRCSDMRKSIDEWFKNYCVINTIKKFAPYKRVLQSVDNTPICAISPYFAGLDTHEHLQEIANAINSNGYKSYIIREKDFRNYVELGVREVGAANVQENVFRRLNESIGKIGNIDVILVETPALFQLDKKGESINVLTKLLFQMIYFDCITIEVPFSFYSRAEMTAMVEKVKGVYLIDIDDIILSSKRLCGANSERSQEPGMLTVGIDKLRRECSLLNENENVYSCEISDIKKLADSIIRQLESYTYSTSLFENLNILKNHIVDKYYDGINNLNEISLFEMLKFLFQRICNIELKEGDLNKELFSEGINIRERDLLTIISIIDYSLNINSMKRFMDYMGEFTIKMLLSIIKREMNYDE